MENEATLTKEQAHALAVALLPEIREYIKAHREEYEQYKKDLMNGKPSSESNK